MQCALIGSVVNQCAMCPVPVTISENFEIGDHPSYWQSLLLAAYVCVFEATGISYSALDVGHCFI